MLLELPSSKKAKIKMKYGRSGISNSMPNNIFSSRVDRLAMICESGCIELSVLVTSRWEVDGNSL